MLAINPNDIVAVKGSKDASARESMQSGGWETAKDYRDLIKDKEQAIALEQTNRVVKDDDTIDQILADISEQYAKDPSAIEVVKKIAALYDQKGDLEQALTWFEYAANLTNRTDPGLVRKATDLHQRVLEHKIKEATAALDDSALSEEEHTARVAELEGLRRERAEQLIEEARKRMERNPSDLQLRFELGEVLFQAGHDTEALPELQKAVQSPNVRIRAMNLLGQCMVRKGMLDLAEVQFKKAASELSAMDDTKKEILYNLALVYETMGRKEDYIDSMKRIYEVDFGYRDVSARVEEWYRKV